MHLPIFSAKNDEQHNRRTKKHVFNALGGLAFSTAAFFHQVDAILQAASESVTEKNSGRDRGRRLIVNGERVGETRFNWMGE
mmetsp:Transcript_27933/g.39977  ORF Transcript_27933/g.39977 Transcript_27933/m.39977 type:complete len:82 (+) Transcript_27933:91-336(+)